MIMFKDTVCKDKNKCISKARKNEEMGEYKQIYLSIKKKKIIIIIFNIISTKRDLLKKN